MRGRLYHGPHVTAWPLAWHARAEDRARHRAASIHLTPTHDARMPDAAEPACSGDGLVLLAMVHQPGLR